MFGERISIKLIVSHFVFNQTQHKEQKENKTQSHGFYPNILLFQTLIDFKLQTRKTENPPHCHFAPIKKKKGKKVCKTSAFRCYYCISCTSSLLAGKERKSKLIPQQQELQWSLSNCFSLQKAVKMESFACAYPYSPKHRYPFSIDVIINFQIMSTHLYSNCNDLIIEKV